MPRNKSFKRDSRLSNRSKTEKIPDDKRIKNALNVHRRQQRSQSNVMVTIEELEVRLKIVDTYIHDDIESERIRRKIKNLKRGPNGRYKKFLRKLAHRERVEKAEIVAAFNEAEHQRNIRKFAPRKHVKHERNPKVVDMEHIRCQQAQHRANLTRRNFSKLEKFLTRRNVGSIKVFLKLLNDSGIKTIPTDLFFDGRNFRDIVLTLLIEHDVTDISIRKYQRMA